ncbi:MAG: hypothetical protein AAB733_01435 [Patescibacteria group bacterium]
MHRLLGIIACVLADSMFTNPAEATVFRVPTPRYRTINMALSASSPGDTILVASGEYKENISFPWGITLVAPNGAMLRPEGSGLITMEGVDIELPITIAGFTITAPWNHAVMFDNTIFEIRNCTITCKSKGWYPLWAIDSEGVVTNTCFSGDPDFATLRASVDVELRNNCE